MCDVKICHYLDSGERRQSCPEMSVPWAEMWCLTKDTSWVLGVESKVGKKYVNIHVLNESVVCCLPCWAINM